MLMDNLPLIHNPAAGGGGKYTGGQLVAGLRRAGAEAELLPTGGRGDAAGIAAELAEKGAPRLVVAGGDGTINEVVNGIAGSETELAIIPSGTANVLALELEIPMKLDEACALAVHGASVRLDLGLAGERYFALMAGAGFDALVIKNINPVLKRTIRRAAFPVSGIRTFFREELSPLSIDSGGYHTEGYFVIASNARYYGGRFGPNPRASMADGLLDICVLKGRNLSRMLRFWVGALGKGTIDSAVAESFRSSEVEIGCPAGADVPLQTDGEVVGRLPVKISIVPEALKVCAGGAGKTP